MPCKRSVMDEEIRRSRGRISRRRALGLDGTIGLGALVTACTGSSRSKDAAPTPALWTSSTAPSDVTIRRTASSYLGVINVGVNASAA